MYSRDRIDSVQNLNRESGLSKKKEEHVSPPKTTHTKFGLSIRRFRRVQAFFENTNEIWCIVLVFIDKLASQNDGFRYFLVAANVSNIEKNEKKKLCQIHFASFQKN